MEPHRRPAGRRVLLPFEADICNTLGLTEDDYWYFLDLTEQYNGAQPEGYELIPAVRNDPITLAVVNLVVGVALTAASALLAPKPQQPKAQQQDKQRGNLQTASITGRQKFTPTNNFDSLQELATLGDTIPLVYTRRGIRVSSQLLWSQMQSFGTGQRLSAIMLISHGPLGTRPDFAGYAIGDALLENYVNAKLKIYWRGNGGRLLKGNAYSEGTLDTGTANDQFTVRYDGTEKQEPIFCGARNPSTQTQFGCFSPVPNGMQYKVEYELVLVWGQTKGDQDDDVIRDQQTKRQKINATFPHRAAITAGTSTSATYTISGTPESADQYQPWSTEDVRAATETSRSNADETITVGEQYLIGNSLAVCTSGSAEPWGFGKTKTYKFKILQGGKSFETNAINGRSKPYAVRTIQRVAIGAVTNNRACHATEIGLKSVVYKQLNGTPNFNSQPPDNVVRRYEDDRAGISLGRITTYVDRYSFFVLETRPLGTSAWKNISASRLFAVKGRSPQAQYNYIRITHPYGQHEFRLRPIPGNYVYRSKLNSDIYLLARGRTTQFTVGGYTVAFSGSKIRFTPSLASNREWIIGGPGRQPLGDVVRLSQSSTNGSENSWRLNGAFYNSQNYVDQGSSGRLYFIRNGRTVATTFGDTDVVVGSTRYQRGTYQGNGPAGNPAWQIKEYVQSSKGTSPNKTGTLNPSGGKGSGLQLSVKTWNTGAAEWTIRSAGQNYRNGDKVTINLNSINSNCKNVQVTLTISTRQKDNAQQSINPYDAIADYWLYDSETPSHADSPEHEIVYVNEQVNGVKPNYGSLAIAGLKINASTEFNSFSNFSAYVRNGIQVQRLINDNGTNRSTTAAAQSTNLFPEVAYDLLTSETRGAGELVGASQVSRSRMQTAAKFCRANGFYWDGAITESLNLRQFLFENAGYCLLDFTILGGQFSLTPSVPYGKDFKINKKGKPSIKALFTDGNIRNLQVTFLSPEERQAFRATVLYREEKRNGFPQTRVYSARLKTDPSTVPEETFDLSSFCTSEAQAVWFARMALQLRDKVDHSIQFETTPQAAMGLAPGNYIRLVSQATHTDRFENGSIGPDGRIASANSVANNSKIIYWQSGTSSVKQATIKVSSKRTTQRELWNSVFAIVNSTTTNRTYKVESITYADDGLIQVAASHVPLTSSGTISYLDWAVSDFVESGG